MSRVETIGDATLYLGDCREILPTLANIDAVITSPPYDQQRTYELDSFDWKQTVCNGLVKSPNGSQVLVNLGLIHRDGYVVRYWEPLVGHMEANGWRLFGWYVWDQMSGMAGDWNGRLAPSHEFIFHFNKTAMIVNKTKPTLHIGRRHSGNNIRAADGSSKTKSYDGRPVQPTKIPDSVIRTFRETSSGYTAEHPARFPEAFARELIGPFTSAGQIVCDPFLGSGTTGAAAVAMGRKFVGIEINPTYFDIACRRIEEATKQPDMLVELDRRAAKIADELSRPTFDEIWKEPFYKDAAE